jgi:AraC-like DNA-binding protein
VGDGVDGRQVRPLQQQLPGQRRAVEGTQAEDVWHTPIVVQAALLPHLRRARDLADRHYADDLDLEALAGAAHVSKYHFARCFAETYGETPMRYLTRRRIERAQDLLRSVNLTVTEVCMLVGFASLGSFSSRFRQLVGESPTQYRDRWAARGGPHIPGCFLFMRGIDRWHPPAGTAAPSEQDRRSSAGSLSRTVPS